MKEQSDKQISRRRLLKLIATAGGAAAATTLLPGEWSRPVVEVGVLPAHAQVTEPIPTATPVPTPQLASITTCHAADNQGAPTVGPNSILETWADITGPILSGIQMRRTITVPGYPSDIVTGATDISGRFYPPDFDLGPYGLAGGEMVTVLWEFVNPTEGTGSCQNNVDIVG